MASSSARCAIVLLAAGFVAPSFAGAPTCTFPNPVSYGVGEEPRSVVLGDLDGDGNLDLVVANLESNDVTVRLNAGDGTLAAPATYGVGDSPRSVAIGDLDGDGDLDLPWRTDSVTTSQYC